MDRIPHWTKYWSHLIAKLAATPHLLVACDFDGTLTPIVPHPDDAWLPDETRCLLRNLSECSGITVAVVSGRSLGDIQTRIGLPALYYAGNHGLELAAPDVNWSSPDANAHRTELADALLQLAPHVAAVDGALLEDKGLTATLHWRLVDPKALPDLHEKLTATLRSFPGLALFNGKAIWEIRPRIKWNKGSALQFFINHLGLTQSSSIYLGDDETDEEAFRALPGAVTLRVGPVSPTAAHLRLNDSADTAAFLFCLLGARRAAYRNSILSHCHSAS